MLQISQSKQRLYRLPSDGIGEERVDSSNRVFEVCRAFRVRRLADDFQVLPVLETGMRDPTRSDRAEYEVRVEDAHMRGAGTSIRALGYITESIEQPQAYIRVHAYTIIYPRRVWRGEVFLNTRKFDI